MATDGVRNGIAAFGGSVHRVRQHQRLGLARRSPRDRRLDRHPATRRRLAHRQTRRLTPSRTTDATLVFPDCHHRASHRCRPDARGCGIGDGGSESKSASNRTHLRSLASGDITKACAQLISEAKGELSDPTPPDLDASASAARERTAQAPDAAGVSAEVAERIEGHTEILRPRPELPLSSRRAQNSECWRAGRRTRSRRRSPKRHPRWKFRRSNRRRLPKNSNHCDRLRKRQLGRPAKHARPCKGEELYDEESRM
jgi:hypothetical protein